MKITAFALGLFATMGVARAASAFCGFYVSGADQKLYNNATEVALMRSGTRTVLSMQNNYQGPPEKFAMVVPVPIVLQKENVKTLPRDVFAHLDKLTAPRLVEYWEQDPCNQLLEAQEFGMIGALAAAPVPSASAAAKDLGVKIEAQFTVGEYEVVVLSAKDSSGLDTWLRQEKYAIPANAEPLLRPYVQGGSKFFVAKVDPAKVTFANGMATLSPLRFHYDSDTFNLPIRLGLVNSNGTQDLIVHILSPGTRYEVSNYPNVTIPTNLDVGEKAREQFPSFYASLFDRTIETHPKAVVTEYAWDASWCDPCPTPAMSPSELATLGADVLPKDASSFSRSMVVTRLHARYGKDAIGEDLVFRAAPPIGGGREQLATDGKLEQGARGETANNFQGRYAIRHPWTGAVACEHPVRGVWGGPPPDAGVAAYTSPRTATDTAFAPRNVQLASFLTRDVPELSMQLPAATTATPATGTATKPAETTSTKRGCAGCSVGGLVGVTLIAARRKRRRRKATR